MIPIEKCLNCTREECIGGFPECHVKGAGRQKLISDERALPMYSSGMSDRKIARTLGVAPGTIAKWRVSRGLAPNYNRGVKIVRVSGNNFCA